MSGPLALLYPVLAQVLLTFVMMLGMGRMRLGALYARRVRVADIALGQNAWPAEVLKVANNAHNQFETPILFYVLCGVATYLGATGPLMMLLAWGYVASRVVHSAIHVTYNRVQHRFLAFALGLIILVLMWTVLVARLLGSV